MSKNQKSRKKRTSEEDLSKEKTEAIQAEDAPRDPEMHEGDGLPEKMGSNEEARMGDSDGSIKVSGELSGDGESDPSHELPEAVPADALGADVPEGVVPRLAHVIEAILFASQKAVSPKELLTHLKSAAIADPNSAATSFARIRESEIQEALQELQAEVAASGRAYQVRETATGWLLSSAPGFAPWLRALYPESKPTRLSASALETLAIIAYRQPIARADMEAVRGVSVDGVMQTLLDRGLVKISGRAEVPGRPLLYATTQYFLDHFGLRHLDELPNASELRHVPLPKATPEPVAGEHGDESTPELNGVSEEEPEVTQEVVEYIEVTDILEVRESVVIEEISFDHVVEETSETSDSEEEPFGEPDTLE